MDSFDEIIDRRGTNATKWDELSDSEYAVGAEGRTVIPMWVADMDFRTAPVVMEALRRRVAHGIFGYTHVPAAYYDALIAWFGRRHGLALRREWVIYTSGVVPAVSAVLKAVCAAGERVVVLTPVYNCFFSSIRNNGLEAVEVPLRYVSVSGGGQGAEADAAPTGQVQTSPAGAGQGPALFTYAVDWEAFEAACADARTRAFLLCNPHNPCGRVWTPDELRRMGDICLRHGVLVVADEIHCELTLGSHRYTPFAALGEAQALGSVTCCSPSKAFNIAGLQIANIVCADADMRRRIDRAININEVCDVGPFGVEALMAAYSPEGEAWLEALVRYLEANYAALCAFFAERLPFLPVARLEGTYLVWVDVRRLGCPSAEVARRLLEGGVQVNEGPMYGAGGEGFVRLNIALPRSRMMMGLERMASVCSSMN